VAREGADKMKGKTGTEKVVGKKKRKISLIPLKN